MQTLDGWNIILREDSTTLSPDPEGALVFTFDREGRPVAWSEEGNFFKRSLASEVHGRRVEGGVRRRWTVPPGEAGARFERLLRRVAELPRHGLDADARIRLEEIGRWTPERLLAERGRFEAAYRPMGILPPDQYLAVVLQATFGCSWNRCTFCSFYQGRSFGVRTPEEFASHLRAVGDLLGRGASLRKRIFLADGDALVLSNDRLLPLLAMAREAFPGRPVSGFVDIFAGMKKEPEEWTGLREAGLARVQVGMETGHDALLEWLNKPGTSAEARSLTAAFKSAGLKVSVIFMVGVGGDRFASNHVRATLELIESLPLGRGDVIYLSPFLEHPGSAYARKTREEGIAPLSAAEAEDQFRALREGIRLLHPVVKVARYDIREFVY